jgi:hypothetical protein
MKTFCRRLASLCLRLVLTVAVGSELCLGQSQPNATKPGDKGSPRPVRTSHLLFLLMLMKLIIERTEETLNNHVPTMKWLRRVAAAPAVFLTFVLLGSVLPAQATPTITVMTPQSGPVGTLVAIMGSGFGASQGSSTVKFNGTPVTWVSWSATLLQVQVPTGATSGNVVVTVSGVASKGQAFTVTPPPVITGLSPTSGPVGATVAITGSNFTAGGTQTPQVVFNPELYASPISSTDTSITVAVPAGATTGDLVVSVGGGNSNAVLFTVTSSDPSISTLSPGGGVVGTAVTITGTSFGSSQGTSTVTFNGTTGIPTNWSATSIKVPVPTGATTGNVLVTVGGVASNPYGFEVGTAAPNITSISPTSGAVATSVTIAGTGFGSTQGTNTVTFNGVSGVPTSWSATQIKVPVPTGATSGSVVVTASGTVSNSVSFTVPGTGPSITGLSPSSGPVGTSVTIAGTNFDATQGTSTVTFNGTAATATGWSPTSIVATVPSGATSGSVVVTVGGTASSGFSFTVAPSITSLSPTSGAAGTSVTITGSSFGSSQGTSTVMFNGTAATPTSWSAGSITVAVPSTAATGNVVVTVGGVGSNGVNFTVVPHITTLSPTSGTVGASVTIAGMGFGSSQGTSTVTFNGTAATTTTSWGATSIVATVPTGATTGNVTVTVGGFASNAPSFMVVLAPSITSLSPSSGTVGAPVTITGTNFGTTQGTSTVAFNGTTATITSWGATSIVAVVPTGATTGNVVVNVSAVNSNGSSFTVVAAPSITSLSPTSGAVGASVTIAGANFGTTQGTSSVTFNGTTATTITSWSATSIVATVPPGATTGNVVVTVGGVASNGLTFTPNSTYANGYQYRQAIVLGHANVSNTDQTDFPVLISGVYSYLANVSNGGLVQSANGYDIVFSQDPKGASNLDFEIDDYNPVTGTVNFWVRIPMLSHTVDTLIYLFYGNPAITASQENKLGVWRNGYEGAWHFTNFADSLGPLNATNTGSVQLGPGKIGTAALFTGSGSSYLTFPNVMSLSTSSVMTESMWVELNSVPTGSRQDAEMLPAVNPNQFAFTFQINGSDFAAGPSQAGVADQLTGGAPAVTAGTWHRLTMVLNAGSFSFYQDGALIGTQVYDATTNGASANTGSNWLLGAVSYEGSTYYYLNGAVDDVNISTVARSADWIATEYANQSSPSTFYTVEGQATPTSAPTIQYLSPSAGNTGIAVYHPGIRFSIGAGHKHGDVQRRGGHSDELERCQRCCAGASRSDDRQCRSDRGRGRQQWSLVYKRHLHEWVPVSTNDRA